MAYKTVLCLPPGDFFIVGAPMTLTKDIHVVGLDLVVFPAERAQDDNVHDLPLGNILKHDPATGTTEVVEIVGAANERA
jgi:hypothetical protein